VKDGGGEPVRAGRCDQGAVVQSEDGRRAGTEPAPRATTHPVADPEWDPGRDGEVRNWMDTAAARFNEGARFIR